MSAEPARCETPSSAVMHAAVSAARRAVPMPGWPCALAFTLVGLALSACMATLSDGVHQDDDLTHLQIARWAWDYPAYLLNDWGRPGFTVLYAVPAHLGWLLARLFSDLLTALTAWLAYLIAARQRVRLAALVPALLWLQPLTFTLSYTTLTETPLAFYLALATWLYLRGNTGWSAAVISLAATTRHEAALFLVVWLVALLRDRRPIYEWAWLAWAPLLHNALSYAFLHQMPLRLFIDAQPTTEYGDGSWLTMFTRWPVAAGIGPLLLAWIGLPVLWRRRGGALWVGAGLAYFATHALLYRFGLFGSGGYFRFLVPIGPMVAVAAAEGLGRFWEARRRTPQLAGALAIALGSVLLLWLSAELEIARYWSMLVQHHLEWTILPLRAGGGTLVAICILGLALSRGISARWRFAAFGLFPLVMLILAGLQPLVVARIPPPLEQCAPLVLTDRELSYRAAANWLQAQGLEPHCVLAPSPWFDEFLKRERPPQARETLQVFVGMQPGEVLLWDSREAASPRHGLTLAELRGRADFIELWHSGGGPYDAIYCAIFEKRDPSMSLPVKDDPK